jgi:hypothetical protein
MEGDRFMQMFKKVALVLVASGFVVGGLAGCGDKKDTVTIETPKAPNVDVKTK